MGYRVGQVAGLLAFVLAVGRLGRLLQTGVEYPPWQLILVAAAFLGGIAWWLLSQITRSRGLALGIFSLGAVLLVMRITVPTTLAAGILPTSQTFAGLAAEMELAWETIATGIPPVEPEVGGCPRRDQPRYRYASGRYSVQPRTATFAPSVMLASVT